MTKVTQEDCEDFAGEVARWAAWMISTRNLYMSESEYSSFKELIRWQLHLRTMDPSLTRYMAQWGFTADRDEPAMDTLDITEDYVHAWKSWGMTDNVLSTVMYLCFENADSSLGNYLSDDWEAAWKASDFDEWGVWTKADTEEYEQDWEWVREHRMKFYRMMGMLG